MQDAYTRLLTLGSTMTTSLHRKLTCVLLSLGLGACGLTLDTDLDPDAAAPPTADAATGAADAGPAPMDAATPYDAGGIDATVVPSDAGADAVVCSDEDGDGVSTCEGDCDDARATVYPGAPMICGDAVDNGCLGEGEEPACMGIGTFVSANTGARGNPGTMALPVLTVAEGLANATTIGGGVDVYVAEGHYAEDVTMIDAVAVRCGYEPAGWTRDPTSFITTLQPAHPNGVQFPGGTGPETELEACFVVGPSGLTSSHAVTLQAGSSGVVRSCVVYAPDNETGRSVGVAIYPSGSDGAAPVNRGQPSVLDNLIHMGRARIWSGSLPATAIGVLANRTAVTIRGNRIDLVDMQTVQRAIEVRLPQPGAKIEANVVRPTGSRTEVGGGIIVIGGSVEITHNDLFTGRCAGWCVGIELLATPTRVSITNNQIFAGESEGGLSAGILFEVEGATPGASSDVLVHSNLVVGGDDGSPAVAVGWLNEGPTHFIAGRVQSNILYAGGGDNGFALWEVNDRFDPERLEANMLHRPSTGAVGGSGLYLDEGSAALNLVSAVNALPEHGTLPSRNDACAVLDPRPDGDPHLDPSSTCIDMGTAEEVPPTDWDGDPRPIGRAPDPGVDETP